MNALAKTDEETIVRMARAMSEADGVDPDHDQLRDVPRKPGASWIASPAFQKYMKEARRVFAAVRAMQTR